MIVQSCKMIYCALFTKNRENLTKHIVQVRKKMGTGEEELCIWIHNFFSGRVGHGVVRSIFFYSGMPGLF